ncbi:MAG: hypothetical protein AAGA69_04135 [Pseudomonadota bacterium]
MRHKTRIDLTAIFVAISAFFGSTAAAQEAQGQDFSALIFVLAFVGGLILFAYVASKLVGPASHPHDERIVPLPLGRRR